MYNIIWTKFCFNITFSPQKILLSSSFFSFIFPFPTGPFILFYITWHNFLHAYLGKGFFYSIYYVAVQDETQPQVQGEARCPRQSSIVNLSLRATRLTERYVPLDSLFCPLSPSVPHIVSRLSGLNVYWLIVFVFIAILPSPSIPLFFFFLNLERILLWIVSPLIYHLPRVYPSNCF